jgi:hypothetical protein
MATSLEDYISNYGKKDPHQKLARLILIIEHGTAPE